MTNQQHNNMKIEINAGVVTNDGQEIGRIEGSVCTLTAKVGPPVKSAIRKAGGEDLTFVQAKEEAPPPTPAIPPAEPPPAASSAPAPMSDAELLAEMQRSGLAPASTPTVASSLPEVEKMLEARPDMSFEDAEKLARERTKKRTVNSLAIAVARGEIPPPPKTNPAMGDKDPAYVEWMKKHATPEEFQNLYGHRAKLPTMNEWQAGEKASRKIGGMKEVDE